MAQDEHKGLIAYCAAFLERLGYVYLTRDQINTARRKKRQTPLLEEILYERIVNFNRFKHKGRRYSFSEHNIVSALSLLTGLANDNLLTASKNIYDLLVLGRSYEEIVGSDKKSFSFKFIDWENIHNNVFHFTTEFEVAEKGRTVKADLALFINGIPFVIIEAKKDSINDAINQHIHNQEINSSASQLYSFSQLLVAITSSDARYGSIGNPVHSWVEWKEDNRNDQVFMNILKDGDRLPTRLEQTLYSLCQPFRLLDLVYLFVMYNDDRKIVPRYFQYFAVKEAMAKIFRSGETETIKGGVIAQSIGSGRTYTMLMVAKSIILNKAIRFPKIIIVTDRKEIDQQIYSMFSGLDKRVSRATTAAHLKALLKDTGSFVITTVMNKFQTISIDNVDAKIANDTFILVDEIQRGQAGELHYKMMQLFPNACYIGFTGLPETLNARQEAQYGPVIYNYNYREAINDHVMVPVYYANRTLLTSSFHKSRFNIPDEMEENDLAYKLIYESDRFINLIAKDISENFCRNWKGSGLKAQLIAPSKFAASIYQNYFDNQKNVELRVNAATVMTPVAFEDGWNSHAGLFNSRNIHYDETRVKKLFNSNSDEIELLIIVDKIFTETFTPHNSILYLAKPLMGKNLMYSIAGIAKQAPGKQFAIVNDYIGVYDKIMQLFSSDQSEANLFRPVNPIIPIEEKIQELPDSLLAVEELFASVSDKLNVEELKQALTSKMHKELFYEKLAKFEEVMKLAVSSVEVTKMYSEYEINIYTKRLKLYQQLRTEMSVAPGDIKKATTSTGKLKINDPASVGIYKIFKENKIKLSDDVLVECSEKIRAVIEKYIIRDWKGNMDIQRRLQNDMEDLLIEFRNNHRITLSYSTIDQLLSAFLQIALKNY
jgi:type I restriction enzyme, R subunit